MRPGEPIVAEVWLGPGEYSVQASEAELRGVAAFAVGREPGPPVRVGLQ